LCVAAVAAYDQAIRLNPKFGDALEGRGDALMCMKDYARAIDDYGQAILLLIAGAIGLLLLSSAIRSGRRRRSAAAQGPDPDAEPGPDDLAPHAGGEQDGSPGNVMTSTQDPTEAPDDLADARRWADDA